MKKLLSPLFALALAVSVLPVAVHAETPEVRIAEQFGLVYLPLTVMRDRKLLEKRAAEAGLKDLQVKWSRFSGSAQMTDAILSGSLDFASGAYANFSVLWDKTHGAVKGVTQVGIGPVWLMSVDPRIKTIKDYGPKDRIALPAVKVSTQALILQMQAAKDFGLDNYAKLDANTVAMGHPDAVAMLSSGKTEVKSHFSAPPYQAMELKSGAHKVLDSYDVFGGPHGSSIVFAPVKYHDANPKTFKAFVQAYNDAIELINTRPAEAAEIYKRTSNDKESIEEIVRQLKDPNVVSFKMEPLNLTKISDFMYATKRLTAKPARWQDVFFPELQDYVKE